MRIDSIYLKNYRCFDNLPVELHPQMTVLVAPNGQGKTSVLDAIKIALWPFVAGFDLGSTTNDVTGIQIDDVLREQAESHEMEWRLPAEIKSIGQLKIKQLLLDGVLKNPNSESIGLGLDDSATLQEDICWQSVRYRESIKKSTKTKDLIPSGALNLNETAKALEGRIFSDKQGKPDDLPMLGYYGTGRLWAQKKLTSIHSETDSESLSRTFAYRDCLDPASSYKHFAVWFSRVHKTYLQAQIRNLEKQLPLMADLPSGLIAPFKAVQQAVDTMLKAHTGWHALEYSAEHEELVLRHAQYGVLKVSQLSDGIRNMLALVGDIAYRCYKLNAHMGEAAPRLTHGIVMIDEVDMHLHPAWQQTVLSDLSSAFPKLQFIVTTHSPQVLSTVKRENIRMIFQNSQGQWEASLPHQEVKGVESAFSLNEVMDVNSIPPVEEAKWLADYTAKIECGTHKDTDGLNLSKKLLELYGPQHPVVLDMNRLIRFQTFKLHKKSTPQD